MNAGFLLEIFSGKDAKFAKSPDKFLCVFAYLAPLRETFLSLNLD